MAKTVAKVVTGVVLLGTIPVSTNAAVRINEIAWMGSSDNANAEWIELFNTEDGEVSLANWTLSASNGSPSFSLAGSISGKGFRVFERSSDYTGALVNTGTILTLKNAEGEEIDTVDGGTDWKNIGGDNTTKHTPQRNTDGSAWITASSTKGSANAEASREQDAGETNDSTTREFPRIYIDGLSDTIVSTHDTFEPEILLYSNEKKRVQYGIVRWTFGDGSKDSGYRARHIYQYPGEYVVAVRAQSNNLKTEGSFVVTVDDASIQIVENSERGIALHNADTRIVSLSNWQIRLGDEIYELPEGTYILPGRTVIFPSEITGLKIPSDAVELRYPNGKQAATLQQSLAVKNL